MRLLAASALGLLVACPAAAGPIRVRIDAEAEPRDPFLVSVVGHYADLHNGHSRHWKEALVRPGRHQTIGLGPVNPLLNMGVSVAAYHPEYLAARERSRRTPLLVRPVGFELRPRSWRSVLDSGGAFANDGPEQGLAQVLAHLRLFLDSYLPALDAAGEGSAARLHAYLPLFEELARFAESDAAAARPAEPGRGLAADPAFARSLAQQDLAQRAEVRELLRRAREWLGLPRETRVVVRGLMASMRYPKSLGEELMTPGDRAELGAFLERHRRDREARREPEAATHWINPGNRVEYRVRILDPPQQCAFLSISVDLTGVVRADLGGMTNEVRASFCQRRPGDWRYGRS
jgi:hypothetical protein